MAHVPRIYWPKPVKIGQAVLLDKDRAHHLLRVLKRQAGDELILFNEAGEWQARIEDANKNIVQAMPLRFQRSATESPLKICLLQAISRGDKMDFSVQKAVELGVHCIQPILSRRGGVQLDAKRLNKKQQHWQSVAQSAAEQSGRLIIPNILPCLQLSQWLSGKSGLQGIVMDPKGKALHCVKIAKPDMLYLAVGPEGGFSDDELSALTNAGLSATQFGPRILRTETAGLVALSAVQLLFGDLQAAS